MSSSMRQPGRLSMLSVVYMRDTCFAVSICAEGPAQMAQGAMVKIIFFT